MEATTNELPVHVYFNIPPVASSAVYIVLPSGLIEKLTGSVPEEVVSSVAGCPLVVGMPDPNFDTPINGLVFDEK